MSGDGNARPRVVIVGGGIAGVALAWLLDGACDVVLLEKQPRLGGHAQAVEVNFGGEAHAIDLGAQLFSPSVHPTFVALLEEIGVFDRRRPNAGGAITRDMGTTLSEWGAPRPRFVSPMFGDRRLWPLWAPWNLQGQIAFALFALHARSFEATGDWSITLDAWLRSLSGLGVDARERVILPWLSALAGCSLSEGRGLSARAAIAVPARALPANVLDPYCWTHTKSGLGAIPAQIAERCSTLEVQLGAAVSGLSRRGEERVVHTTDGRSTIADYVVFAAPPHATRSLLAELPGHDLAADILGRFRYFRTRMVIHADPVFMPADRRMWSAYNAVTTANHCEASIWFGALRDRLSNGSTLDVFKSWATARPTEPRSVHHEAEFLHPLICPAFVRAQHALERRQGIDRIWFAGSYCQDVDLQETAVRSAIRVAAELAPRAPNLLRLTRAAHVRRPRSGVVAAPPTRQTALDHLAVDAEEA